jgi:hypothetical protein
MYAGIVIAMSISGKDATMEASEVGSVTSIWRNRAPIY